MLSSLQLCMLLSLQLGRYQITIVAWNYLLWQSSADINNTAVRSYAPSLPYTHVSLRSKNLDNNTNAYQYNNIKNK